MAAIDYPVYVSTREEIPLPSVVASLLPENRFQELKPVELRTLSVMLTKLIKMTALSLAQQNPREFDGNPGDFGCQRQALLIHNFMATDLLPECRQLQESAAKIQLTVERLCQNRFPNTQEIRAQIESLPTPSRELKYMLLCRQLQVVRMEVRRESTGVIVTKSLPGRLSKIWRKMAQVPIEYRREMVTLSQFQTSVLAMEMMREEVAAIQSLDPDRVALISERLSLQESPIYSISETILPRMFACLLYDMEAVMTRLKEEQAVVCLKGIEVDKSIQPYTALFRSAEAGAPLEPIPNDELLPADQRIVVLEAVITIPREKTIDRVMEIGLTELVLRCAAEAPPYYPRSTIEDVGNEAARDEIRDYAARENPGVDLDHVYCSTLEIEGITIEGGET